MNEALLLLLLLWHASSAVLCCYYINAHFVSLLCSTGLQCYECLSLYCDSAQICKSIRDSIARTFVPNSHYIHFNPTLTCPSPAVATNSSEWDRVSFNCSRSDSLCLEAPLEVITVFDGSRQGKKLDPASRMLSQGILRGCANRRGLRELPTRTLTVKAVYAENETGVVMSNKKSSSVARDEYKIAKLYSHEIYLDHGTENATRCYMDDCNNRKKLRMRGSVCKVEALFSVIVFLCIATTVLS